jgi:hypothetical protein
MPAAVAEQVSAALPVHACRNGRLIGAQVTAVVAEE